MNIQHFFDKETSTLTYLVWDENSKSAFVIDPVLNYESAAAKISYESPRLLQAFVSEHKLNLQACLETHAHADHLSSSQYLKEQIPSLKIGIGENICEVQKTFAPIYNFASEIPTDGSQFNWLFADGQEFEIGSFKIKIFNVPGHTPACVSYLVNDCIFTGDCIFMPDSGTGRCDFPGGSAEKLYESITRKIYSLPDSTRLFVGHDYQPGGRELRFETTVGEQKSSNIHLTVETTREKFVEFRQGRDKTLSAPKLLWPSLQVNINAGQLPKAESNGTRYLKLPLKFA